MADADSTIIRAARKDWMSEHLDTYLSSGGAEGHVMDLTPVGGHPFTTHCLVRTIGRKTGRVFVVPLIYGDIGGEVVICASKGGAANHPAWYFNITDTADVDFQVATQAYRGRWREPAGAEREKIWAFMLDVFPPYGTYQASTDRVIPLVMMTATTTIPVFKLDEITGSRP